jgi:hypothetical protein
VSVVAATVRLKKLRETLNTKLGKADMLLWELREADKPRFPTQTRLWDPNVIVMDFLLAARGVYPVMETFAKPRLTPAGFKAWVKEWEKKRLSPGAERKLWRRMRIERVEQEHGEGVKLKQILIPITEGEVPGVTANVVVLGLKRADMGSGMSKGGVRFTAYPDTSVSVVCAQYLALCRRFVADFLQEHGKRRSGLKKTATP